MSDRKRQLRRLLERYRDRAAAITLEMPELKAIAARQGALAAAASPAPAAEASAAEAPSAVVERPAPAAADAPEPASVPVKPRRPSPEPSPATAEDAPARGRGYPLAAWLSAFLAAALAGGAWILAARPQLKSGHRVVALPLSSAVGLARRGPVLYSFDRARMQMAAIDSAAGGVLSLKRFPHGPSSGIAASPEKLWSADANGFLHEHRFDDEYSVRRTFANPDRRPSALHWDGTHLWIADARTNSLYEYTVGASLVPARQFTLPPGVAPVGLHVESGLVWVLDANSRAIRRFRARALLEPVDSMNLKAWISAPRTPTGMVVGEHLWISSDGPAELHRFDLRKLSWRADD